MLEKYYEVIMKIWAFVKFAVKFQIKFIFRVSTIPFVATIRALREEVERMCAEIDAFFDGQKG